MLGPGSIAQPFCTIGKGAGRSRLPEKTVRVLAGSMPRPSTGRTPALPATRSRSRRRRASRRSRATAPRGGNAFRLSVEELHRHRRLHGRAARSTTESMLPVPTTSRSPNNHVTLLPAAPSPHLSGRASTSTARHGFDSSGGNTSDHNSQDGIRLTNGCTNVNLVSNNVAFANAEQWERNATGIQVQRGSSRQHDQPQQRIRSTRIRPPVLRQTHTTTS